MNTFIITFYSHFSAIHFHKEMKKMGIDAILMPIPRYLSSSCGTCVKISLQQSDSIDYNAYDGLEKAFDISVQPVIMVYES